MAKYTIPNQFPSDLYQFAKPHAQGQWTSYPTYSYEQFYRANPADPKARYKALKAVADDERANENERKIARRLMAKMEAEGLVKPSKAKKNPRKARKNPEIFYISPKQAAETNAELDPADRHISAVKPGWYYWDEDEHDYQGPVADKATAAAYAGEALDSYGRSRAASEMGWTSNPRKAKKNPRRHTARRNSGEPVFVPVASNAGRFTPNIFPYGMGGRPAVYKENPRPGKYKATQQAGGRFAIPEKAPKEGSFPIDTIKRARYALAIVASPAFDDKGTTRDRVIKAVVEAYPSLRAEADHVRDRVADRKAFRAAANPRRRR
jgi:hypothetical protein